jgi:hypothetical protein
MTYLFFLMELYMFFTVLRLTEVNEKVKTVSSEQQDNHLA